MSVNEISQHVTEGLSYLTEAPVDEAFKRWNVAFEEDMIELRSILYDLTTSLDGFSSNVKAAMSEGRTIARAGRNAKVSFEEAIGNEQMPSTLRGPISDVETMEQTSDNTAGLSVFMGSLVTTLQSVVKSVGEKVEQLDAYVTEGKKQIGNTALAQSSAAEKATNYLEQLAK